MVFIRMERSYLLFPVCQDRKTRITLFWHLYLSATYFFKLKYIYILKHSYKDM